jgi:hypothetical protein
MKKLMCFSLVLFGLVLLVSCTGEMKDIMGEIPLSVKPKECSIKISQNGEHFLYVKEQPEGESVVYDGAEGPLFLSIEIVSLNSDGTHYAYLAYDGKKEFLFKDAKEIANYDYKSIVRRDVESKTLQMRAAGNVVYTKKEPNKYKRVYQDGNPIDKSPFSALPEVSRDGTHLLYWAVDGAGDFLVFDGKRNKIKDVPFALSISGDGNHYGAVVRSGKSTNKVLIDGDEKLSFDMTNPVLLFRLSNTGSHYLMCQKDVTAGDVKIKYDGTIIATAENILSNSVAFSADDLHYAIVILKPPFGDATILLDAQEIVCFDPNFPGINNCYPEGRPLVFDPSGNHLLYAAGDGTYQIVALDQKTQMRFDLYNTELYQIFYSGEKEISCFCFNKVNRHLLKVSKAIP